MSAPVESAMSGGNAEDSHLEQPRDAVPMKDMSQSLAMQDNPGDDAAKDVAKHTAELESSSSTTHPPAVTTESAAGSHPPEQGEASAAPSSSKGKEKEVAPAPPAKEDEPKEEEDNEESIMAADDSQPSVPGESDGRSVCNITLLLASGSRHPYKIDAKYLSRRNVAIPDQDDNGNPDPFSISIYTLKELILREWRSDWEAKPASPSSIRLIHFGKLLDDKEQLKRYQFSTESPNVVHMSIRPQDLDEEEPKTGSKSLPAGGGDRERVREGRCCVIL